MTLKCKIPVKACSMPSSFDLKESPMKLFFSVLRSPLMWIALVLPASLWAAPPSPPTISESFGAANIPVGGATSLGFTIANSNPGSLTGVGFTDTLPAGLVVATPNGLAGSCGGGAITATAGSGSVSLSGATLAASSSCNFSVNVTGTTAGTQNNTTSTVSSNEGGAGSAATASLVVQTLTVPVLSPRALAGLALLLAGLGWGFASLQDQRSRPNV
jgi:hypothetical protein